MKKRVPLLLTGVNSPLVGVTVMSGSEPWTRWAVKGSECLGEMPTDVIMASYVFKCTHVHMCIIIKIALRVYP